MQPSLAAGEDLLSHLMILIPIPHFVFWQDGLPALERSWAKAASSSALEIFCST